MMSHAPATLYPTVFAHVTRPTYFPHVAQPFPCAPRGELTDVPCADHLAVVLSQAYADKVDPVAARHAMIRRRFRMAQKQICYIDDIDMDVIGDCVVLGEQRDAAAFLKAHTQAAEAKNKFAAGVAKLVEHVYPCVMADVEKAREKVDAKKVRAATRQARRFFQAQLEKDFLNAVLENKPIFTKVFIDKRESRFRCYAEGFKRKSFSWLERGQAEAAKMALRQLWEWNALVTGHGAPPELDLA